MNRNDIYKTITDKITAKLASGNVPWRRSWNVGIPRNLISKRVYNGINFLSLMADDYPSPFYLTFLQAKERGSVINKGATGSLIVFGRFSR